MSDIPLQGPGDGALSTPAQQPEIDNIGNSSLQMIQKTATANLASTMNDRSNHSPLEQHDIENQADARVGYNSLSWELREQIRQEVIADLCTLDEKPLLSAYACVDSEWRDAIEKVTFRRLNLKEASCIFTEDLDQFERYVVGERRQHPQHIHLPVYVAGLRKVTTGYDELSEQGLFDDVVAAIRRFFNCLKQWPRSNPESANLHVQIQFTGVSSYGRPKPLSSLESVFQGLTNLPAMPQITDVSISRWDFIDFRSMQALLSHMPNVQSAAVCLNMPLLNRWERMEDDQDYGHQIQCKYPFSNKLSSHLRLTWGRSFLQLSVSKQQKARKSSDQV